MMLKIEDEKFVGKKLDFFISHRNVNDGFKVNTQSHLVPILASVIKAELNKPLSIVTPHNMNGDVPDTVETRKEDLGENSQHHPLLLQLLANEIGCSVVDI